MTTTLHRGEPRTAERASRRQWTALAVLAVAQLMLVLDMTVVNVALPSIGQSLDLSRTTVPWVMTAYTVAFGGLMLFGGRIADLLGARRVVLVALVGFTVASAVGGLAHSSGQLLASRAGQGVAAAFLSPAALALVTSAFDGEQRRKALGVWGALSGAGAALGVLLGGVLTSTVGWRWVFYINLPIGIAVLVAVPAVVTAGRGVAGTRGPVDALGAALVTTGTATTLYGLINSGVHGWTALSTLLPLGTGLSLWGVFVAVERRVRTPLLELRLFARRAVSGSAVLITAATALLVGGFFLASFLLQRGEGYSALRVGVLFLPTAVATVLGAQVAGHLLGTVSGRVVAPAGLMVAATGYGVAAVWTQPVQVVIGLAVAAVGIGACFVTAFTTALADVTEQEAGLRSAITNTFHELGGSIGVAVMSSVAGAGIAVTGFDRGGIGDGYAVATGAAVVAAVLVACVMPAVKSAGGGGLHGH